jgi:hypothetical protein
MRRGVHRMLVHEVEGARMGDDRGACAFADIIDATPGHLCDARLYGEIAMNLGCDATAHTA